MESVLIALSPIILIIILVLIFRKSLLFSSPIVFLYSVILGVWVWGIKEEVIFGSIIRGLLIAVDISVIVFGAIFFLEFLKQTKILNSIENYLSSISSDKRVQAIILVWFFGSFIEGTAGFGTPAAIVAPLLVGLGFPAVTAVVISLIGNTTAVVFGAVGTPIRIGFASIQNIEMLSVAFYAGLINLIASLFVPVIILYFVVKSREDYKRNDFISAVPFALFAGLCFGIPYFLLTFIGWEFPSLVGSLIGLVIIAFTTTKGFLVPKEKIEFKKKTTKTNKHSKLKAFLPYFFLVAFLILGRFLSKQIEIILPGNITHSINLFNPGFAFLISILLCSLIFKIERKKIFYSSKQSFKIIFVPFIVILFIVAFVQIMINSGINYSGYASMIEVIARLINNSYLVVLSPVIGAFGSFIAGSATVSNILFGEFQLKASIAIGISSAVILAMQLVGAGVGNMLSLTNIVAAQAAVKLKNKEFEILKKLIVPFLIYIVIVILTGLLIIFLKPG